ncbi:MAG: alpha/beta fold hydrolase [Acidobacteria bacterium]|nr:alpha/beta fold hydrolase [Acidobacteriota bacterium]
MTPLVLVHGVGLDRHMWAPFSAALGRPVVTYDMLGLGDADKPVGPYTLSMYAQQLREVVADAGGGPADVVGFSMGALVAQRFAADHPHLVRRMVLVSGVFDRTAQERAAIVARVAEVRAGAYLDSVEPALERWFTPAFTSTHPDVVRAVRDRMRANEERPYADAYEVFATGDEELVPLVPNITAPTLVVTGADDQRSTPSMTERLAASLPNGRAVVVPGVRHLLPIEQPALLADLVRDFLHEPEEGQ